jgi:hypothetical protein
MGMQDIVNALLNRGKEPNLRPFNPGERVENPDGSFSTERTVTVQGPDGRWMVMPSLWMGQHGPVHFQGRGDDFFSQIAGNYQQASGENFPTFPSLQAADAFAARRSKGGGASHLPLAQVQRK